MTPELVDALGSPHYWIAINVTVLVVALAVGLQYEVLRQLNRRMPHWKLPPHPRILVMIFCILGAHIAEIWLFGFAIYGLIQEPGIGRIVGSDPIRLLDAIYISATTYSTLGYGDLVPTGPIRFLLGTEAVVGIVMITWSASFAYLEMARYWKGRD
jgi:Ion channel